MSQTVTSAHEQQCVRKPLMFDVSQGNLFPLVNKSCLKVTVANVQTFLSLGTFLDFKGHLIVFSSCHGFVLMALLLPNV